MHDYDKRIIRLVEWLLFQKKITSSKEFCLSIGLLEQTFSKIKKGNNHFTVLQIEKICKTYKVNSNWIFGVEKNVFRNDKTIEINDF